MHMLHRASFHPPRFSSDNQGAALIEFAIVFPISLLLILGIIELCLIYWGNSMMDNALLQASRQSMVGCIRADCAQKAVTHAKLLSMIQKKTGGFIRGDSLCLNATRISGGSGLGESGEVVSFTLSYQWPIFSPFTHLTNALGLTNNWIDYSTSTVVRNEPFASGVAGRNNASAPRVGGPCSP